MMTSWGEGNGCIFESNYQYGTMDHVHVVSDTGSDPKIHTHHQLISNLIETENRKL